MAWFYLIGLTVVAGGLAFGICAAADIALKEWRR